MWLASHADALANAQALAILRDPLLSYADVPSVARLGDGTLVAQWLQNVDPIREAYDLRLSYSKDNGKTWAPSFLPHHDGTKSQHGFASLVELPGSTLGVVWLDGRNSEFLDNDPTSGTMTLRYAAYDSSWKQTTDAEIDHNVCECCSTAAALTADGVLVAFRDRVVTGEDAGRSWGTPIRLDDVASLGRVGIELLDDGSAVATWVEYASGRAQFRLRRVEPSGGKSPAITVSGVSGGGTSGFPRLARHGNELVFAWTESAQSAGESDSTLTVHTAIAHLPQ